MKTKGKAEFGIVESGGRFVPIITITDTLLPNGKVQFECTASCNNKPECERMVYFVHHVLCEAEKTNTRFHMEEN